MRTLSMVAELCTKCVQGNFIKGISIVFMATIGVVVSISSYAQKTCTSNPTTIAANINFGSITWTASGGATVTECNNMADGLITFTGNVVVDVANNTTISITNDVNITGNFPISGGPGSVLSVSGGSTLHVTGDLGDAANNGVQYNVAASNDAIVVDGTLYGKNNNAFTGSGSISGGTLNVKNGTSCGSPCPVAGGFDDCIDSGTPSFCTSNMVPITLLYFNVIADGDEVKIDWATESEQGFDHFEILHASSNLSFSTIESIQGVGYNTNSLRTYSTVDPNPVIGDNYYRLKAVDTDGSEELFKIKHVRIEGQKKLTVYPNPVRGNDISVKINFEPSQGDHIMIYDAMGAELLSMPVNGTENGFRLNDSLKAGTYLIKYVSPSFSKVTRVIVIE